MAEAEGIPLELPSVPELAGAPVVRRAAHRRRVNDSKSKGKLVQWPQAFLCWYHEEVKKEDRVPMTPKVCFHFCKKVPGNGQAHMRDQSRQARQDMR